MEYLQSIRPEELDDLLNYFNNTHVSLQNTQSVLYHRKETTLTEDEKNTTRVQTRGVECT